MAEEIRCSNTGKRQVRAVNVDSWTPEKRAAFLDRLAAWCNVKRACADVELTPEGAYALRRRDAGFAADWRAAMLTGYDRLEAAVLEDALKPLEPVEHSELPEEPFDREQAMRLLKMYYDRLHRPERVGRGGATVKRATPEETDAAILKQLEALRRRAAVKPA
ncbi:hypothetical protein [Sphingomonas sp. Leaf33]|uniref:hypothetical protein n=1 Tax=Sphingomonas sp. Leaf33 TaxID=1736215 RepID=UPI0012E25D71|nr:hypothetical protein [Sphingomonas sp. Leaf33]